MKTLLLALLLAPLAAHADFKSETQSQLDHIEKAMNDCLATPDGQSMMGMKECTGVAYVAADKVLNSVYKQIKVQLETPTSFPEGDAVNKEYLRRLVASERAWIHFRDADTTLAGSDSIGGSLENLEILGAEYSMTKARALQLTDLYNRN